LYKINLQKAHNPKVIGSNPFPATSKYSHLREILVGGFFFFQPSFQPPVYKSNLTSIKTVPLEALPALSAGGAFFVSGEHQMSQLKLVAKIRFSGSTIVVNAFSSSCSIAHSRDKHREHQSFYLVLVTEEDASDSSTSMLREVLFSSPLIPWRF